MQMHKSEMEPSLCAFQERVVRSLMEREQMGTLRQLVQSSTESEHPHNGTIMAPVSHHVYQDQFYRRNFPTADFCSNDYLGLSRHVTLARQLHYRMDFVLHHNLRQHSGNAAHYGAAHYGAANTVAVNSHLEGKSDATQIHSPAARYAEGPVVGASASRLLLCPSVPGAAQNSTSALMSPCAPSFASLTLPGVLRPAMHCLATYSDQLETYITRCYIPDSHHNHCLLFNSGWAANVGLLGALAAAGDYILLDEQCHNSIWMGARLSRAYTDRLDTSNPRTSSKQAPIRTFRHNSVKDLRRQLMLLRVDVSSTPATALCAPRSSVFVVVESLYSMEGSIAPLEDILHTMEEFPNAYLVVDEVHAFGVYGPSNRHHLPPFHSHMDRREARKSENGSRNMDGYAYDACTPANADEPSGVTPLSTSTSNKRAHVAQRYEQEERLREAAPGTGVAAALGLVRHPQLLCIVLGFGKAAGCHGGAIVCPNTRFNRLLTGDQASTKAHAPNINLFRLYLVNYARSLIYSTGMGWHALLAIHGAFGYLCQQHSGHTDQYHTAENKAVFQPAERKGTTENIDGLIVSSLLAKQSLPLTEADRDRVALFDLVQHFKQQFKQLITKRKVSPSPAITPHTDAVVSSNSSLHQQNHRHAAPLQNQSCKNNQCALIASHSPIQSIIMPGAQRCMQAAQFLQQPFAPSHTVFQVLPVRQPTVPRGQERLRVVLHSFNTKEEVNLLLHRLQIWLNDEETREAGQATKSKL